MRGSGRIGCRSSLLRWTCRVGAGGGVLRLLQCCLLYAWGLGFVFGMAQYGLLSTLKGWPSPLMEGLTLTMSIGLMVGMVGSGALGGRPQRRGRVLLLLTSWIPQPLLQLPALTFGIGMGSAVLAFPIAEASAPLGQTAMTVSIVNTCGTLMGGVMTVVSGLILQASSSGDLSLVLVIYGALALFGVVMAGWISLNPELVDAASTLSMPGAVPSRE
jgi:hypothetical protein